MKKLLLAGLFLLIGAGSALADTCRVTTSAPTYANNSTSTLSCTTAGGLRVDTNLSTLLDGLEGSVDGIEALIGTTNTNTGAATTALQLLDNAVAGNEFQVDVLTMPTVTVTGGLTDAQLRATAVPISAASLPLPSLAATSTKQSDGTQKTQIVDGAGAVIASTSNNLNVQCANCSGSGASAVDAASFTASTSVFAPSGGFFQTTATANPLTTGQQGMAQMTANRAYFNNLRNAAGAEVGVAAVPLQVSLANTGANGTAVAVSVASVPSHAVTNAGTFAVQNTAATPAGTNNIGDVDVLTSALPTGASTSANQTTMIGHVDGIEALIGTTNTNITSATITLDGANNADNVATSTTLFKGSPSYGFLWDGTTWDRQKGDSTDGTLVNLGANNDVTIAALPAINLGAAATGGCTPAKTLSAATNNSTSIKGSAGTLCKLSLINTTAVIYYLKTYNTASAPTCASDTVVSSYPVPPAVSGSPGGVMVDLGPFGEAYTTGIGFCLVAALADNDNTSAATGVVISYSFK